MNRPTPRISRRNLLAATVPLAACAKTAEYFETTQLPYDQQLTYLIAVSRSHWMLVELRGISETG
jgi:hypothetical protein